ncbi:MAG: branched-chain amino acid ABC transporter substrate-binding protein [Chloroflexota bacterium]|nr:branched-chain amino acid ABC transporter substrate-binding protein [Chloroflexota bacterium]
MLRKSSKLSLLVASLSLAGTIIMSACGGPAASTPVPTNTTGTTGVATATTGTTDVATATTGTTDTATATTGTTGDAFEGDTIKIGVDLPVSGGDATIGLPTRNGMELAIRQANENGGVTVAGKTYELEMYFLDDVPPGGTSHDPAQSSKNADSFIADPAVLVVLGPFNSSNAQAMMPKLNTAGLCQISPSNTNETLTKPEFGQTQNYRPTGEVTYFRVAATDDIQGPAAADYAYNELKLTKVYVLDDTETYGKGIADNFKRRFEELGGTVLGHDGVPKGTTDFSSIMTKVAAAGPDLVYYGGTSSNNIPLARKAMKSSGLDVPLMGGDGIQDAEFLNVAGEDAVGSYSTVAAVNVETLDEAKQFIEDYNAAGFKEPLGAYSGPGYEVANIAIDALTRAEEPSRDAVCEALRNTKDYKGVLGTTSFDENGDTTNKVISFYRADKNDAGELAWVFVDQIRFGDE